MDLAGQLAGDLDRIQRRPVVGIVNLLAVGIGLDEALEGEFHVLGGQFAVVAGEFQAFLQRELDRLVVDLLDIGGRVVLPFGRARLELHQPLADGEDDVHLERAGAVRGVEVLDVLVDAHDQLAVRCMHHVRSRAGRARRHRRNGCPSRKLLRLSS